MSMSAAPSRLEPSHDLPALRIAPAPAALVPVGIDDEDGSGGVGRLLKAVRHRWPIAIALGGLVGGVFALAAYKIVPAKFTTTAMLRVYSDAPHLMTSDNPSGRNDFPTYVKTQAQMLRSQLVISSAIRDPEIAALPMLREQLDPVKFLEEEIKVEFSDSNEIVKVSLSGEDPRAIAKIVNGVTAAFKREVIDEEVQRKRTRLLTLNSQLAAESQRVEKGYDALKYNQPDKPKVKPDPSMRALAMSEQNRLRGLIDQYDVLLQAKRDRITRLDNRLASPADELLAPPPPEAVDASPAVAAAIGRAKERANKYDYFRDTLGSAESSTTMRALKAEIAQAEDEVARQRKTRVDELTGPRREQAGREAKREHDEVAAELKQLENLASKAKTAHDEHLATLARDFAEAEGPIDIKKAEVKDRENLSLDMIHKASQLSLEVAAPPRVREVQEAAVPVKREAKKQILAVLAAGLAGLGLTGLCVGLFEGRKRRIYGLDDALAACPGPALGVLPGGGSASLMEESVEKARAELARRCGRSKGRALVLTSAVGDEGQTVAALHLARSFARSGARVLLIDADAHHPALHKPLGLSAGPGFGEVLGGLSFDNAVQTLPNGVKFLPAGKLPERSGVTHQTAYELFDAWRSRFDWVVIRARPILSAAEAGVLAQVADAVVICVARHTSLAPLAARAYEKASHLAPEAVGWVYAGAVADECLN